MKKRKRFHKFIEYDLLDLIAQRGLDKSEPTVQTETIPMTAGLFTGLPDQRGVATSRNRIRRQLERVN